MRILFFNYEFPPLGGGAGNASAYLLKEYVKLSDLEVDFVTASIDNEFHLEKISDKILIHRLPIGKNSSNIHFQSQKEMLVYSLKAYFYARKLAKKNQYQLSHAFFTVPCGFISMLLKWEFKIPFLVSLRGSDVPGYSERFTFLYKFITPIIKLIWQQASFVIANSQGLKALALKAAPQQFVGVIGNGINVEDFCPDKSKLDQVHFNIVCVSRITPRKGIRFLIQAFKLLSGRYGHLRLFLVGGGNEKESLEQLVRGLGLEDKIIFLGEVSHDKVLGYFQKANVFAMPSLNEGMSNSMLEALACGNPLISTNTGGAEELIVDGKNGFIVKMQDSNDLAEKLEKIILNPELEKSMSAESRKLAEQLSWKAVADEYAELYQQTTNLHQLNN